jgi:spermidine/putrescine transport system substrate-binding protein
MPEQDPADLMARMARAKVNRRGFMAGAGLTGMSAFLAACAGGSASPSAAASSAAPSVAPSASGSTVPSASASASAAPSASAVTETEGALYMYNWSDYVDPTNIETFKSTFKVSDFTYDTYASNEELVTKLQGGASGLWDIGAPTAEFVPALAKGGYIQQLDFSKLPNAAFIDPQFQNFFKAGTENAQYNSYHLPKDWGTTGIALRRKDVTEPVSTWKEFFAVAPKYSGKIVVVNSMGDVFTAPLKSLGYSVNTVDKDELEQARQLLLGLAPHVLTLDSDTYQLKLGSEEAVLGLVWTGGIDDLRKDPKTADTEYIIPKDGTLFWMDTWVMFTQPPHPNAAYAFLNFIHDPEVQAKETITNAYATPNTETIKLLPKEVLDDTTIFVPSAVLTSGLLEGAIDVSSNQQRQDIWEEFSSKIGH